MTWDWYQATVEEPPLWLRGALQDQLAGSVWSDSKPRQGYSRSATLVHGGQVVLELLDGGQHEWPHVVATGGVADSAARVIRAVAPRHFVSRADVCEDVAAPGWFESAFGVMVEVAKARRVKPLRQGDWDSDNPARTLYLGAPSSVVRVRLYEKGKQLIQEFPEARGEVPTDWCRLEVQVRPAKREDKRIMALVEPELLWGCSRFSKDLADKLLATDAPRLAVGTIWKGGLDFERAEYHMIRQYARVFKHLRVAHGSAEAVGRHIYRCLDDHDI